MIHMQNTNSRTHYTPAPPAPPATPIPPKDTDEGNGDEDYGGDAWDVGRELHILVLELMREYGQDALDILSLAAKLAAADYNKAQIAAAEADAK